MSELNINDLSTEMIIKVLRFLDQQNLKNATLTCKRWKDIIESACRWQLVLRLNAEDWEAKLKFVHTTNRKFGTISIVRGHFNEASRILNIFEKHGKNVVKLVLMCGRIDNHTIAKLLNLTPNLMHAVIQIVNPHSVSDVPLDQDLPELRKLSNLEIFVADEQIVTCFRKAKLKTLRFEDNAFVEHHDALVDFLSSQEMLTSLNVTSHSHSSSILVELGKKTASIPFRLMHLKISDRIAGRSSDDHRNLLRFVKSQAENLEELTMGDEIPISVYECVFAGMTKLNTLNVRIDRIPQDNDFHVRWEENCSVRTIKLRDFGIDNEQFFENFFKKLPNARNLIVSYSVLGIRNILLMAQNLSQLESLSVGKIFESEILSLQFPNLKTLSIGCLRGKINWHELTRMHPRLAELTIEEIQNHSFLTSDDIDKITTNVDDLHTLRLGEGFVADDRFFGIIRKKCKNMKVLILHRSCISDGLNHNMLRLCNYIETMMRTSSFNRKFSFNLSQINCVGRDTQ